MQLHKGALPTSICRGSKRYDYDQNGPRAVQGGATLQTTNPGERLNRR